MANVKHETLNALTVKALKKPGIYTDGNTLTFRITEKGTRSWVQRISIEGRQRNIGLGAYPAVGLAEARQKARENAKAVREGHNPIEDKKAARKEAEERASVKTFWEIAQKVIENKQGNWDNPKTKQRWINNFLRYVVPIIGKKRPRDITREEILQILEPIWLIKKTTSNRIRQTMSNVFDYAIAKDWCKDNPADNSIREILPQRPKSHKNHHRTMPYEDVPAAVITVRESNANDITKLAIEFLTLTASRSKEVRLARWNEIDLSTRKWIIPPERMKSKKEHRVPLTDRMIEILEEAAALHPSKDLIFPNPRKGKPYSDTTFSKLFLENEIQSVPHGLRSCFKTWTMEQPNTDHVMAEIALAHTVGNEVEQVYANSDMFEKRRDMMQNWTNYIVRGIERDSRNQKRMELN